jgi:hypothetical protein
MDSESLKNIYSVIKYITEKSTSNTTIIIVAILISFIVIIFGILYILNNAILDAQCTLQDISSELAVMREQNKAACFAPWRSAIRREQPRRHTWDNYAYNRVISAQDIDRLMF